MSALAVVGTLNYADRFLPAVLAEPVREDLSLSDTAIGVINGFGLVPRRLRVGRVADRLSGVDPRWLLWLWPR